MAAVKNLTSVNITFDNFFLPNFWKIPSPSYPITYYTRMFVNHVLYVCENVYSRIDFSPEISGKIETKQTAVKCQNIGT